MKDLIAEWSRINRGIGDGHIYLFLDFDGTLAPIRKRPGDVKLSAAGGEILRKLVSCDNISVAIVSGRQLKDVRKLVGIGGAVYAGNHGLEVSGPDVSYVLPGVREAKGTIRRISGKLKKEFSPFKGVIVEDKGFTLSVHFRMVRRGKTAEVSRIFKKIIEPYESRGEVVVTPGKKVWEVRPPVKWDKGAMVLRLLGEKKRSIKKKAVPFYIGDDRTDEDAFRRLKGDGYSVKVTKKPGDRSSLAGYYLRGVREVRKFLRLVYSARKGEQKNV